MKIIRLEAENVKRLRAVEIEPDGNMVVISGRNGQGKTSILDAIAMALGGAKASKLTSKPIRDGEKEASVTLDLGDFTVTRKWRGDNSTLRVESKDGAEYKSPQRFLDEKLGALSFDPLAFANDDPKKQLATLLGLVKLSFDPEHLDAQRLSIYTERTEIGRALKSAEATLEGLPHVPAGTPEEEVSVASVLAKANAHADQVRKAEESQRRIAKAQELIVGLEKELSHARLELEDALDSLVVAPEPRSFDEEIAELESVNQAVRLRR